MLLAFAAATAAGLATALGALPLLWTRVSRRAYDAMLGVGAGLMLSAATLGLIGHAVEGVGEGGAGTAARLALVVAGFAAGVGLMAAADRFIPHVHAGGHRGHLHAHDGDAGEHVHDGRGEMGGDDDVRRGLLLTGGMALHRVPEGFAIGAGFAHGGALGLFLSSAIALQNVCEGMVMSAPLRRGGLSRTRTLALAVATGLALPASAVAGVLLSRQLGGAMPLLLALAAGGLIYLVSNEMIPESHSHGNEGPATMGLVVGFLATVVLQTLTHHE